MNCANSIHWSIFSYSHNYLALARFQRIHSFVKTSELFRYQMQYLLIVLGIWIWRQNLPSFWPYEEVCNFRYNCSSFQQFKFGSVVSNIPGFYVSWDLFSFFSKFEAWDGISTRCKNSILKLLKESLGNSNVKKSASSKCIHIICTCN